MSARRQLSNLLMLDRIRRLVNEPGVIDNSDISKTITYMVYILEHLNNDNHDIIKMCYELFYILSRSNLKLDIKGLNNCISSLNINDTTIHDIPELKEYMSDKYGSISLQQFLTTCLTIIILNEDMSIVLKDTQESTYCDVEITDQHNALRITDKNIIYENYIPSNIYNFSYIELAQSIEKIMPAYDIRYTSLINNLMSIMLQSVQNIKYGAWSTQSTLYGLSKL